VVVVTVVVVVVVTVVVGHYQRSPALCHRPWKFQQSKPVHNFSVIPSHIHAHTHTDRQTDLTDRIILFVVET